MQRITSIALAALVAWACSGSGGNDTDAGADIDSDTDTDADADAGEDTDSETDSEDGCADEDPFDPADCPEIGEDDSRIRYVDADAPAGGDGLSWAAAYTEVQPGLDAARCVVLALGGTAQLWVAEGTYYVYRSCLTDAVRLREGVEFYGGFGGGEAALAERDWVAHVTTLDGHGSATGAEQVFHVVLGAEAALIDGFSITGGNASPVSGWAPIISGGGLLSVGSAIGVRNCTFAGNVAASYGGAMALVGGAAEIQDSVFSSNQGGAAGGAVFCDGATLAVSDCTFDGNSGGLGGALWSASGSNVSVADCSFLENSSNQGGAVQNMGSTVTIEHCTFEGNTGIGELSVGGALRSEGSSITARDCVFSENSADYGGAVSSGFASTVILESCVFSGNTADYGGVLHDHDATIATYTNCTFTGNTAATAGGVLVGAFDPTESTFANSILWNNGADPIALYEDATATVSYSDVEGGYDGGVGNIDADPLFVDAAGGDFHLSAGSPCIDAANGDLAPEFDIEGQSRWDDPDVANTGVGTPDYADMGAYEWQG